MVLGIIKIYSIDLKFTLIISINAKVALSRFHHWTAKPDLDEDK